MKYFFEKYRFILIIVSIIVITVIFYFKNDQVKTTGEQIVLANEQPSEGEATQEEEAVEKLFVDVKGAIKIPGLYEFEEGDRVFDVLEIAGGILENADEKQINYAQRLEDEMIIYIPKKGEIPEDEPIGIQSNNEPSGKININKANEAELTTLSGIGPAKAEAIIQYREENGPFKSPEDLLNISGIGTKTLERFEGQITVK